MQMLQFSLPFCCRFMFALSVFEFPLLSPFPPADFYYNFSDTKFYTECTFAMAMVGIILMV